MITTISNSKPVETIEWLAKQAAIAKVQSDAVINAMKNFADQIEKNKTVDNLEKLHIHICASHQALERSWELHHKLWSAQVAACTPTPVESSPS